MPKRSKRPKPRFYLKDKSKKESYIQLKFCYGAEKHLRYDIGEKIKVNLWNQKTQSIKSVRDYHKYEHIQKYIDKIYICAVEVLEENGIIPTNVFRNKLDIKLGIEPTEFYQAKVIKEKKKNPSLMEYIPMFIKERLNNKQTAHKKGTNKNFGVWYRILLEYIEWLGRDIDYDDINWTWIKSFQNFCFTEKNHSINNVQKGITYIKQFVNSARREGYTNNTIVTERNFNIKKAPVSKVVFTLEDFQLLSKFQVKESDLLFKPRILNIIGGFTGMRYNMWSKINKELIKKIEGEEFIELWTSKTNEQVAVPFDPIFREALEMVNYKTPKLSRQRLSDYSKILWKEVGITEKVEHISTKGGEITKEVVFKHQVFHPHCLRRSFASNMYIQGIPAAWLMPITGHRTEKQFFEYINIAKQLNAKNVSRYMKQLAVMREENK